MIFFFLLSSKFVLVYVFLHNNWCIIIREIVIIWLAPFIVHSNHYSSVTPLFVLLLAVNGPYS